MIGAFRPGERVSVHDGTRRTLGTVVQVLAGRLLVIDVAGRRIRRHSS